MIGRFRHPGDRSPVAAARRGAVPRLAGRPAVGVPVEAQWGRERHPHGSFCRGEVAGLKWADLGTTARRLSVRRSLQNVGGRPTEFGIKTRTSRRIGRWGFDRRASWGCYLLPLEKDRLVWKG